MGGYIVTAERGRYPRSVMEIDDSLKNMYDSVLAVEQLSRSWKRHINFNHDHTIEG